MRIRAGPDPKHHGSCMSTDGFECVLIILDPRSWMQRSRINHLTSSDRGNLGKYVENELIAHA